jgi:MSHA pilin protein MshD
MTARSFRQRGLTLIELIVFIVVVSVGLVGVLSVFNLTVRSSADPMQQKQMLAIAEAMMDEILLKDFQNDPSDPLNTSSTVGCTKNTAAPLPTCGTNSQVDRKNYNDVSDYDTFDTLNCCAALGGPGIYAVDGTSPISGLTAYTVHVDVGSATSLGGLSGLTVAKHIVVTVSRGSDTLTLDGFRTNYGG